MTREFKFRAWDMINNAMVQVWGINYKDFGGNMIASCFAVNPVIKAEYLLKSENTILMQFTGLKDYKGKEIYEGDLLRRPAVSEWDRENFTAFEVFFHDGDAAGDHIGWVMNRTHYHGSLCGGYVPRFLPKNVSEMEVIGNIYANPELLKTA